MEGDFLHLWSRSVSPHSCTLHCMGCAVRLQSSARMGFHRTRTVMSRGGDKNTADHGGRARTGGDTPKSSGVKLKESLYILCIWHFS